MNAASKGANETTRKEDKSIEYLWNSIIYEDELLPEKNCGRRADDRTHPCADCFPSTDRRNTRLYWTG